MASEYGVSTEGFRKKRLFDIRTEIENELKNKLGSNINLLSTSLLSQLIGTFAERESLLWELAEQVYNSQYLNSAEGINLDNVLTILGVTRLAQTKSIQKNQHLKGSIGTIVPIGTKFSVLGSPASVFETITAATLVAGADEVQRIVWGSVPVAGSYRLKYLTDETALLNFNANAAAIQTALNDLTKLDGLVVTGDYATGFDITFAGLSGKINHDLLTITSNTTAVIATVSETTAGVPQGLVDAQATTFGQVIAPAFTLTVIDTPVVGLDSATNPVEAVVGRNTETDAEVRVRALIGQKSRGAATVEAIRARLLELTGVTQAIVFENITNVVDSNGLPPKSFRAFVQGGENQVIWDALWLNKPAGIPANGDVVGTVVDSQGLTQTVAFARPVIKTIYITIEITKDPAKFPANGSDLVKTVLAAYINALEIGSDVIVYPSLVSSLTAVPGIIDVRIGIGFTPAPPLLQDANLIIAINEIAKVVNSTTDIGVTVI